jgi:hypothetical protein
LLKGKGSNTASFAIFAFLQLMQFAVKLHRIITAKTAKAANVT